MQINFPIKSLFFVLVLFIVTTVRSSQQDNKRNELLRRKEKIEKEIELADRLIKETQKRQELTIQELKLLNAKIRQRAELIKQLDREIDLIDEDLQEKSARLISLQGDLEKTRNEYSLLVLHAFKNSNTNLDFMFLLASEDVSQFYSRYIYLQQYKEYRKKSIQLIIKLKQLIEVEIVALEKDKQNKLNIMNKVLAERAILLADKTSVNSMVGELKVQESSLKQDLDAKKKLKRQLEEEIASIIKKETRKNKYKDLTPEEKLVSDNFSQNKGSLPWPTEMGIITDKFGEHPHPVRTNLKVRNNGIDITTVPNSKARVIFNGIVSKVFTIKGTNSTVIVRHGNYYTVYQNLVEVYVKAGDQVSTKQYIGEIYTDPKTDQCIFHFELWEELEKQNPELWLSN